MLLYLYGKEEGHIQHFLIKSFKSLQIVVPHRNICFGKLPLYTKYFYRTTDSKSFPEKALLLVLIKKGKSKSFAQNSRMYFSFNSFDVYRKSKN